MAKKPVNVIVVVVILAELCFGLSDNTCISFQDIKPSTADHNNLLTFSLHNTCSDQGYELQHLTVELEQAAGAPGVFLCNIISRDGACVPSGACICNGSSQYVVKRHVDNSVEYEVWHLTAVLRNGRSFSRSVTIPEKVGLTRFDYDSENKERVLSAPTTLAYTTKKAVESNPNPNPNPSPKSPQDTLTNPNRHKSTERTPNDDNPQKTPPVDEEDRSNFPLLDSSTEETRFFQTSEYGVVVLAAIVGLFIFIAVVLLIVWRRTGHTPITAVRNVIRRSQAYDEAYEMRRPVVPTQAAYIQTNMDSMPRDSGLEPYYSDINIAVAAPTPGMDGYIPMDKPRDAANTKARSSQQTTPLPLSQTSEEERPTASKTSAQPVYQNE